MAAGKKKHWITVNELVTVKSEFNSNKELYFKKFKIRAEVKFNSNFIGLSGYELIQSDKIIFRVYRRNIQYTDRIEFNGITYAIVSLSLIDYGINEMELIAEKVK